MKKISFILALAIAGTTAAFAQANQPEHTNNLNPYAYGVNAEVEDGMMALTYQLNAPATAVELAIYRDGEFVREIVSQGLSAGLQNEVIDLSEETVAGKYTVGIRVHGTRTEAEQLGKMDGTNFVPTYYSFWHSKAVAANVNPYSPNFGRIIVTACMADVTGNAAYWDGEGPGLYAYNAAFAPIANGNARVFTGGATFVSDNYATGEYGPDRIAMSPDGSRIFVSQNQNVGLVNIFEVSEDLQTWTPYVSTINPIGEAAAFTQGIAVRGNGEEASVIALQVTGAGRGADTDLAANAIIREYNGANATDLFAGEAMMNLMNSEELSGANFYYEQSQLANSELGGFWISTGRAAGPQLIHVNAEGVRDFIGADGYTGAGAIVERNGKLYVSKGAKVCALTIGQDANGLTLTEDFVLPLNGTAGALNGFTVDYANNLYAVCNYGEVLVAAMLPYSGVVETPVDAEIVVEAAAIENVEAIAPVQKVVENGQVVIIKNGVRYNALGIQL